MLHLLRSRPGSFVLVLVAVALTSAASGACYMGGFDGAASPPIIAAQALILVVMGLASWAVLKRLRRLGPEVTGFERTPRAAKELPLGFVLGVACPGLVAVALTLTRLAPFKAHPTPPSVATLLLALVAFVVNGALQQVQLQSLAVAASRDGRFAVGPVALAQLVFVGMHAAQNTAPLYVLNVALFGLVTTLLFFRGGRSHYALPVGLHAGWNFTEVCGMGYQGEGLPPHHLALFQWPTEGRLYSGGPFGLEGGVAVLPVFVLLLAALVGERARAGVRSPA